MKNIHTKTQWRTIDQADNPVSFIHFMDMHHQLEEAQFASIIDSTFQCLNIQTGGTFLDVGCGAGDNTQALIKYAGVPIHVVGVDISERMIAEARRRSHEMETFITYSVGDASSLPFEESIFDGCYAFGSPSSLSERSRYPSCKSHHSAAHGHSGSWW
jgi:ubiquinone/menaquinone biosynthesis C-methylase UbiE